MIDWDLVERLSKSTTLNDVFVIAESWSCKNGFCEFGLATKFDRDVATSPRQNLVKFHNYKNEISKTYGTLNNPDTYNEDPRIQVSLLGVPAVSYDCALKTSIPNLLDIVPGSRRQVLLARECGVRTGIITPLHTRKASWGFISFSSSYDFLKLDLDQLVASSSHFSQAVATSLERMAFGSDKTTLLSIRENEVLRWASIGKTSWEISIILKISERTVNFHFSEAARKLGVKGRRAACTAAMMQGLIQFA